MALPVTNSPDDLAAWRRVYAQLTPSAVYLRLDDELRVSIYNSAAGVTLAVRSRILGIAGELQMSVDPLTPSTARAATRQIILTDEGWLLGGEIAVTAGTPLIGQCYAVVEVVRGLGANAQVLQTIAAGYVATNVPLPFLSLPIASPLDGGGAIRSIAGATPAAGAEISETVPTNARWELLSLFATLTTSAVVANRQPRFTLDDGATVYGRIGAGNNQAASTVTGYTWAAGVALPTADVSGGQLIPLPVGNKLGAGHRIRTATVALDVADQYSAIRYLVREWIEGQ